MYVWGDNNHLQGTVRNIIIITMSRLYDLYERISLLLAIYNAGCQFQTENFVPWNDVPKRGWNEDWVYDLLYWVDWPVGSFPSDVGNELYHQINSTFQQTAILVLLHVISKIRNKDSLIPWWAYMVLLCYSIYNNHDNIWHKILIQNLKIKSCIHPKDWLNSF